MQTLTVKEALEQGYEHYVFNMDGFQGLQEIVSVTEDDLVRDDIRIVAKDPQTPAGIASKDIAEMLADHLECNYCEITGSDTLQVYEAIKDLDFSEAEKKIAEALSSIQYYSATDIKLIP